MEDYAEHRDVLKGLIRYEKNFRRSKNACHQNRKAKKPAMFLGQPYKRLALIAGGILYVVGSAYLVYLAQSSFTKDAHAVAQQESVIQPML